MLAALPAGLVGWVSVHLSFDRLGTPVEVAVDRPAIDLAGWKTSARAGEARGQVLMLHGSSRYGAGLPLYRLLSRALSQAGFEVFAFDFRGYGRSDDPPSFSFTDYDFRRDIEAVVATLGWQRFHLVGHSLGASVAMSYLAQTRDPRVQSIVGIGPTRRAFDRALRPNAPDFEYMRRRLGRDMGLGRPVPADLTRRILRILNIDDTRGYFQSQDHCPLLLLDGGTENPEDLVYLESFYRSIAEPKRYVTIRNADHYANTQSLFTRWIPRPGKAWDLVWVSDPAVLRNEEREILGWIDTFN